MNTQPLKSRWQALTGHFFHPDKAEAIWAQLEAHYTEPGRAYHNLEHIADCFAQFDQVSDQANNRLALELAIFFHDVIYDPKNRVKFANEENSAELAEQLLKDGGMPAGEIGRVVQLILDTRHDQIAQTADGRLLVDIDLSILGSDSERFWRYEEQIREEYSWVEEEAYRQGRTAIMQGFLTREKIYQTNYFFERCETQARENLASLIKTLQ